MPKQFMDLLDPRIRREMNTRDVAIETEHRESGNDNTNQMPSFLWSTGSKRKAEFSVSNFFSPNSVIRSENRSPFYEGRTTFGGASSKRARLVAPVSPYTVGTNRIPSILRVKAKESKDVECRLSNTARTILASMEKMSTPLEDAKKMPSFEEAQTKQLIINPFKQFRKQIPGRRSSTLSFDSLEFSSVSDERPPNTINLKSTEVAQASNTRTSETRKVSTGGKIRTTVTKNTTRRVQRINEEIPEQISLPNAPLPIKTLPSFDFKRTDSNSNQEKDTYLPKPTTTVTRILDIRDDKDEVCEFTFTAPLLPKKSNKYPSPTEVVKVSLSKPVESEKNGVQKLPLKVSPVVKIADKVKIHSEVEVGNHINDLTNNKMNSTIAEKPKSAWNWTKMSGWSCPTCMIQNSNEKLKCAACETFKPGYNNVEVTKSNSLIEKDAKNKLSDVITKSGSESKTSNETKSSSTNSEKITSQWGSKFTPPADTWECDMCLVRNKAADSKCIACENPRTSLKDKSDLNKVYSGFNFENVNTSNNSFVPKFGIPQKEELVSSTPGKDENVSPTKVTVSTHSEGFGAFSNTSPTYSMTTTSTAIALTTTGSGFNFGSLSSPKLVNSSNAFGEPILTKKPLESSNNTKDSKSLIDNQVKVTSFAASSSSNAEKLNKEEKSSSTSLFTFGTSSTKSSEELTFKKKVEDVKTEVSTANNFFFGKAVTTQNSLFSAPTMTKTSSSTFGSFPSEKKESTKPTQNSAEFQSVFESTPKTEVNAFKPATLSAPVVTVSSTPLLTNPANTSSGFNFSFGMKSNSLTKPVTNSESTNIPTTTPVTVTSKTPAFVFGASSVKSNTEPFSFTGEPSSQPATTGGFKFPFGTNSPMNASSFSNSSASNNALQTSSTAATTTTTSSGGFQFGSMLNSSKTVNSTSFSFGSPPQPAVTTNAAAPASFNFNEKPSLFTFGGTKNSSLQPQATSFNFGQRQSTPQNFTSTTSPFVFGSQPANAPANTASQGFSFNSTNNTLGTDFKAVSSFGQNAFQFGQPASQPPQNSGLTFGAPAAPNPIIAPQPSMPINFSQTPNINFSGSTGSVFQFNANTAENALSSGLPATRNIKKAKRRLGPT